MSKTLELSKRENEDPGVFNHQSLSSAEATEHQEYLQRRPEKTAMRKAKQPPTTGLPWGHVVETHHPGWA